ncbi:MAG: hypothetical protein AAF460_04255, partial [Pseudomonadota bacterium]
MVSPTRFCFSLLALAVLAACDGDIDPRTVQLGQAPSSDYEHAVPDSTAGGGGDTDGGGDNTGTGGGGSGGAGTGTGGVEPGDGGGSGDGG